MEVNRSTRGFGGLSSVIHLSDYMTGLEDKIVTKANLEKKVILVKNSLCSICGEEEETTSHMFCKCRVTWLVGQNALTRCG